MSLNTLETCHALLPTLGSNHRQCKCMYTGTSFLSWAKIMMLSRGKCTPLLQLCPAAIGPSGQKPEHWIYVDKPGLNWPKVWVGRLSTLTCLYLWWCRGAGVLQLVHWWQSSGAIGASAPTLLLVDNAGSKDHCSSTAAQWGESNLLRILCSAAFLLAPFTSVLH